MTAPAQISPEVFPVVLGSVLIIASVVFTAFTIWVVFGKWRDNHRKFNKVDENLTERLEWVYGSSNEELDSFEEGGEKAILAWKGLSCSYPSKVIVNILSFFQALHSHVMLTIFFLLLLEIGR